MTPVLSAMSFLACLPPGPPSQEWVYTSIPPDPDCQPVLSPSSHPLWGTCKNLAIVMVTQRWRLGAGERRTRWLKARQKRILKSLFLPVPLPHLWVVLSGTTSHTNFLQPPHKKLSIVKGEGWAVLGCLPRPTGSSLGDAGPSVSPVSAPTPVGECPGSRPIVTASRILWSQPSRCPWSSPTHFPV